MSALNTKRIKCKTQLSTNMMTKQTLKRFDRYPHRVWVTQILFII